MSNDTPDWADQLKAALEQASQELTDALTKAGHILTAQGVMAWTFQGEFDKARGVLTKVPDQQLGLLAMAGRALAELADEEAARR